MINRLLELIWKLIHPRDKCQICYGSRGGVYGNENILPDGTVICDYCHADRPVCSHSDSTVIDPCGTIGPKGEEHIVKLCNECGEIFKQRLTA